MDRSAIFYPHKCYCLKVAQREPDENGDYNDTADNWELLGPCRAETNGSGTEITTTDGKQVIYSEIVYFPVGSTIVDTGAQIVVLKDTIGNTEYLSDAQMLQVLRQTGQLKSAGYCLKFDETRLHSRMWVK